MVNLADRRRSNWNQANRKGTEEKTCILYSAVFYRGVSLNVTLNHCRGAHCGTPQIEKWSANVDLPPDTKLSPCRLDLKKTLGENLAA